MKTLIQYLGNYKKESVLGPLFKLLEASFELVVPLVVAKMIDVGIANQDRTYIILMGGLLIGLGIIGLTCSITAQYFAAKAATGFGTEVRNQLFVHLNQLSYEELDQVGTATLITRMTSDINQVQSGVNMVLRLFLRSPFIVIGAMIMAFTVDRESALVFVVTIPILSLIIFGIMRLSMPFYQKVQQRLDHITLATRENLVGVRVIRALNQQKREEEQFEKQSFLLLHFQQYVGRISGLLNPMTYIVINAAIIALLWIGGEKVNTGHLTQGEVVALVNYMSQILVELIKLANLIVTITKGLACANRISELFHMTPSIVDQQQEAIKGIDDEPIIQFSHVSFSYGNSSEDALSDIHFEVKRGQTIGIIGGTGSGKTSLVQLIPRLYEVCEGAVYVHGRNVKEYPQRQLRAMIGLVPQKAVLFKGTIKDNLRWGKKNATQEEMERAMVLAQAGDIMEMYGLDYDIEQGGKNLSGGQRQRLTIARAFVKQPEILIFDDSASALDYATEARLRRAIEEETKGMTVLIVSQRASSVRFADQIVVLDDGQIVGLGTHETLIKECHVYQEICRSQLTKEEECS